MLVGMGHRPLRYPCVSHSQDQIPYHAEPTVPRITACRYHSMTNQPTLFGPWRVQWLSTSRSHSMGVHWYRDRCSDIDELDLYRDERGDLVHVPGPTANHAVFLVGSLAFAEPLFRCGRSESNSLDNRGVLLNEHSSYLLGPEPAPFPQHHLFSLDDARANPISSQWECATKYLLGKSISKRWLTFQRCGLCTRDSMQFQFVPPSTLPTATAFEWPTIS